jgi:hypothetical protein
MSKKKKPAYIIGDDGEREVLCMHGIGHGRGVHTCDGCCSLLPLTTHPLLLPKDWKPK